jgi:hypothetical protein
MNDSEYISQWKKSYLALQKESYVVLVIKCIFLECNAVYVKHEYVYQN